MQFEEYLRNVPLLHQWAGEWTAGGFSKENLETLYKFLSDQLPPARVLLETGAGNSTIMMLFLSPRKIISIAPDADLFDRIYDFCRTNGISSDALEVHADGSEWVLPRLAAINRQLEPILDFALIDGCHGWPTCFVDLEYANSMLKRGGYLLVDDVQLHTVKEMARFLVEESAFSVSLDLSKSLVFRKTSDDRSFGDWWQQPYAMRRSDEYARSRNAYSLGDFRARRMTTLAHWAKLHR